jgi:hypothetical protein
MFRRFVLILLAVVCLAVVMSMVAICYSPAPGVALVLVFPLYVFGVCFEAVWRSAK